MAKAKKKSPAKEKSVTDQILSYASSQAKSVASAVKTDATASINTAIRTQILPAVQNFAEQGLQLAVQKILEKIPTPQEVDAIATKISNRALELLQSDIIPKILVTQSGVSSLGNTENKPDLYEALMSKIPVEIDIPGVSKAGFTVPAFKFGLQASMRKALTRQKFEEISRGTKDVVLMNIKNNVTPTVKTVAKNAAVTLFFVGTTVGVVSSILLGKAISYNDPIRRRGKELL